MSWRHFQNLFHGLLIRENSIWAAMVTRSNTPSTWTPPAAPTGDINQQAAVLSTAFGGI